MNGLVRLVSQQAFRHSLSVRPSQPGLCEITTEIAAWLADQPIRDGLLTVFIRHPSASLLIQENADPDVRRNPLRQRGSR